MHSSLYAPPKLQKCPQFSLNSHRFLKKKKKSFVPGMPVLSFRGLLPCTYLPISSLLPCSQPPASCPSSLEHQLESCHSQPFPCSGPLPPPLTMPIGASALVSQETVGWEEGKSELRTYECIMLNILEMDGPGASPCWGSQIVLRLQKGHY